MQRIVSHSEEETEQAGYRLAARLEGRETIALRGDLGAGKTAFVRGLARGLGIECAVVSPTYAIACEYQGRHKLYHMDCYRLSGAEELWEIGFGEYDDGIIAMEWSERVESALPPDRISVQITVQGGSERLIEISGDE